MAGEGERTPPQSPRSKALLQHFERKVRLHAEHLDEDVRVTNERLGQLETAQIETNTKLASLEAVAEPGFHSWVFRVQKKIDVNVQ